MEVVYLNINQILNDLSSLLKTRNLDRATIKYYLGVARSIIYRFGGIPNEMEFEEFVQEYDSSTKRCYIRVYNMLRTVAKPFKLRPEELPEKHPTVGFNSGKREIGKVFNEREKALIHQTLLKVAAILGIKITTRHLSIQHGIKALLKDISARLKISLDDL